MIVGYLQAEQMKKGKDMTDISIHDNIVTGYKVSCEKREIVLHTEFRDREPNEKTDVVFRCVEAYYLVGDNMHSILFDVGECDIDWVLENYSSEFEDGIKYVWPGPWNESLQACREHFRKQELKGWAIHSAYGLAGFVIAKSMELRAVT